MATGMTEMDGTPPFKRRKSIQDADTYATPSPSARTWVQTFNRLAAPFFGVPAFTSPPAPPIKKENTPPPPPNPVGYKHVFGAASVKAPAFTFAPPSGKQLFQHTLQGPQVSSKPPLTPLKSAPDGATETDTGIASSASAKLRRICAFFSKPTAALSAAAAAAEPTPTPSAQPAPLASSGQNVPAVRHGPTRAVMIHSSGGLRQFRNTVNGEVTTVGLSGKESVAAPCQPAQRNQSVPPTQSRPRSDVYNLSNARAGMQLLQNAAAATAPWRAPPPSHVSDPSAVVVQAQFRPGAKRSHAETMAVVPTEQLYPRRTSRRIASAVGRLPHLSLDDPTFLHAVQVVQGFTDYTFKSHEYIREALYSPRMPISIGKRISLQGNQRLAMLGDSLLKLAILEEWEGRVQYCSETEKQGSRLWCNATLARIGRNNGLDYLLTNLAGGYAAGFVTGVISVATAMEAILGAVWFDCGKDLTVVRRVVRLWYGKALA